MADDVEFEEINEIAEPEIFQNEGDLGQEPEAPDDDVPEFIRGKDAKELAKIIQNQKDMIDRQSQEVGEVRKLADELIKSQLHKKPEVEQPQEIDFFENPQEAIRRAVESNPKVLAAEQMGIQSQQMRAKQMLVEKHPDFNQVVGDSEFVSWVKASPVRVQLYQMADNHDFNAADELLSTFKQLKQVKQVKIPDEEVNTRKKTLNAASVGSSGSGETSKKVYRRADLIRLRMNDPSRYDAMSDEITRAYQEGRVK